MLFCCGCIAGANSVISGDGFTQQFDVASLRCASSLPVRTVDSSRDLHWASLLLDHQQVLNSEEQFETLPTSDQTVVVMTRGEQEIEVFSRGRWRRAAYRPDTIGLTPGGMTDRLRRRINADAGPACKINLYIAQALFDEAADHLRRAGSSTALRPPVTLAQADCTLRMAAQALLQASRAGAPSLYADSMAQWLAIHLLTSLKGSDRGRAAFEGARLKDKRLSNLLEFMEHNFSEQLSVDRLAREAAISKFHFTRLFHQATGFTPHRWLCDRRLDAAKQLLETTDLSVGEIADRCGFAHANYFATAFSKRFGISPSDYRLAY